jgi:hypothetical protein
MSYNNEDDVFYAARVEALQMRDPILSSVAVSVDGVFS